MKHTTVMLAVAFGLALTAPATSVLAQWSGDPDIDECIAECLASGGGPNGDGRQCKAICAKQSGGGEQGGGSNPPGPSCTVPANDPHGCPYQ